MVRRVRGGESELFELIMRRYNQRLYRVARSILRDDVEAEDVMQQAYLNAFAHLDQFAGNARFSTWLTRIAVHEALAARAAARASGGSTARTTGRRSARCCRTVGRTRSARPPSGTSSPSRNTAPSTPRSR